MTYKLGDATPMLIQSIKVFDLLGLIFRVSICSKNTYDFVYRLVANSTEIYSKPA